MTDPKTANEVLYDLAQSLSPDDPSSLNEEVIEAAEEAGALDGTFNAAAIVLADKILGVDTVSGTALNELVKDYQSDDSIIQDVRITPEGNLRATPEGDIRRTA